MSEAGLRGSGHDVTGLLLLVVAAISLLALFGDKAALLGVSRERHERSRRDFPLRGPICPGVMCLRDTRDKHSEGRGGLLSEGR